MSSVPATDSAGRAREQQRRPPYAMATELARELRRPARWPIVGRDEELSIVREAVRAGVGGIVLAGRPGVGKTRLARTALDDLASECAIHWLSATPLTSGIPLAAFTQLIPENTLQIGPDRHTLFRAAAARLSESAAEKKIVIGVDDAHLLDDASAALLLYFVESCIAAVIATIRSGEPCPAPVMRLWQDDWAQRLDLQPFGPADVSALLEAALGGSVDYATVHRLMDVTEGNALFLHEVVVGELESGNIAERDGMWRWDGKVGSSRVRELVEARIAALKDSERACLDLIAIGEPLPFELLEACADPNDIGSLETTGLVVTVSGTDSARLAHPLYTEVMRAQMPLTKRRRASRALAAALRERKPRRGDEYVRLAVWSLDGGEQVRPSDLVAAARASNARFDHRLAERLARTALEASSGVNALEAAIVLAHALVALGRLEHAERILARYEKEASAAYVAEEYLKLRSEILYPGLGRSDEARALVERAASWPAPGEWMKVVGLHSVRILLELGDFPEAVDRAESLVNDPELDETNRQLITAFTALALTEGGRTAEAQQMAERGLTVARETGDTFGEVSCLAALFTTLFYRGRWRDAEPEILSFYDLSIAAGNLASTGPVAFLIAQARLTSGDLADARHWHLQAIAAPDVTGMMPAYHACLAYAQALVGDLDGATKAAARMEAALSGTVGDWWWQRTFVVRADAWIAKLSGDSARAWDVVNEFISDIPHQPTQRALLLHELARLGHPPEELLEAIEECASSLDSALIATYVDHVRALVTRDGGALDAVAATFERFGARLLAAEAYAEAARAYRDAGHTSRARASAAASEQLAETCDGARTPALVAGLTEWRPGLTPREWEVAVLAGRGLSNAEIADRLTLSVRTVETHVYRACAKLGVSRRDDLPTIARK